MPKYHRSRKQQSLSCIIKYNIFLIESFQSSIRKPITIDTEPKFLSITSMSSPQLLFSESNEQSTNNNNRQQTIKKELDRQSSLFIRGHRPTIENLSPNPQVLDMTNISENQLSLTIPPNFLFRNKPSRVFLSNRSSFKINDRISSPRIKPSNYSKTVNDVKQILFHPKSIHRKNSLPTPIWTPTLTEQDLTHTRTLAGILRSKSHLSKFFRNRQSQKRTNTNLKPTDIQDLYISPRLVNNPQHELEMNKNTCNKGSIVDECKCKTGIKKMNRKNEIECLIVWNFPGLVVVLYFLYFLYI